MLTRPLDLSSKLRPPPRGLEWLFLVNAGLLALFFSLFGSKFVLAPGMGVNFRLPTVVGANSSARPVTHVISVINSGQVFTNDGLRKVSELRDWLKSQAAKTESPALLVQADVEVTTAVLAEIASAARSTGFELIWAAGDPGVGTGEPGR